MCRKAWKRDNLYITYSNPIITSFKEGKESVIKEINEVMYFYYDVDIMEGKKVIFGATTHDFPKVQDLPHYIDYIINMKEEEMFVYEDLNNGGFHRKKLYNFITLNDDFGMDCEYFYKIEKMITYVKQSSEKEYKRYEQYELTIGKCEDNKEGYDNGEPYGNSIFIKYLTEDDLLRLKQTAIDFCNIAIETFNKQID